MNYLVFVTIGVYGHLKKYRVRYDAIQEDLARLTGVYRETIGNLKSKYHIVKNFYDTRVEF